MWPRTDFLELSGLTHPIVQAPMSGLAPATLAAAVCNAGALGSIGCAVLSPAVAREQVATLRQVTNRPFNLNFFVHIHPRIDPPATARVRGRLAAYFDEFGLGPVPEPKEPIPTFDEERLRLVLEIRPPVVSFHFGLPGATAMRQIKEAGCIILSSATTVAEARLLEANGADAIIAQGFEAGGHRGSFTGSPGAGMVGTMALVPQIVDAVRVPVIAAGGIADGRGIAAAFALGASGAQIGTAFLGCLEATLSPLYRAQLRAATDDVTELTRVHRPPSPGNTQPLHYRDGRLRVAGISAADESNRPPFAAAGRRSACRVHAGLGGSGCSAGARPAGGPAGRNACGRSSAGHRAKVVGGRYRFYRW
jgi:nitronate monooxygenase